MAIPRGTRGKGLQATLFDSTVIREAQEVMEFLTNVLEASTEYSIIAKDIDGKILLWNEGARRMYGYTAEEVVGKANSDILHTPEDMALGIPRQIMDAAMYEGKWEGVIGRVRKDGKRITARVVMTPRRDVAGRPAGFLLISKDVSDDIRLTEALRESQYNTPSLIESNITPSLLESNIDAMMTTDPLGIITDVNQQMEALTAYSREELIGTPFKTYFTDPQRAEEGIRLVLREGNVTNYELTARSRAGHETVVSYNGATIYDRDGKLQGVFASARDVTERKRFEQTMEEKNVELENASLVKDRFLASISHELRTPLNAIIGFTGTMLMGLPGPLTADQDKQLRTIQGSARHLLSLINDLLDLTKIESGKVAVNFEAVDCQSLVQEVANALRPLAEGKGLAFTLEVPTQTYVVQTDRRALSQILINLTNNAIKFTERGQVCLELRQRLDNGRVLTEVSVSDTGIGIRTEDQTKLFGAFSQVGDSASRRHEGTGLGLYLSQKLATLLRGSITFASKYGQGSTFTIILPEI